MKTPTIRYFLHVLDGADRGGSVRLGTTPLVIGRSHNCGLRLSDEGVSRSHVTAVVSNYGVQLDLAKSSVPFLVNGSPRTSFTARGGDVLQVGATRIAVSIATDGGDAAPESEAVRSLLLGHATLDAPALGALLALLESLDDKGTDEALLLATLAWARRHRLGQDVRLDPGDPPASSAHDDPAFLPGLVRAHQGRTEYWLPADRERDAWLVISGREPKAAEQSSLRAVLLIAAEFVGSALRRVRREAGYRAERRGRWRSLAHTAQGFLGPSAAARELSDRILKFSAVEGHVLLLGESGVGKSFAARLLHEQSKRAAEPLVELNCAAIPSNLLEAELFGHERGAFTDAVDARDGAFATAGEGTLFLDEIGELPLEAQAKVLRALDARVFQRLGSNRQVALRARVVAATNRPLAALVKEGSFREDLYFRLSVLRIDVPPLRERRKDIVPLARHLLEVLCAREARAVVTLTARAEERLEAYPWPGNVRELRNILERALALHSSDVLDGEELELTSSSRSEALPTIKGVRGLPIPMGELEERNFEAAQKKFRGDAPQMADALEVSRMTVYRWQERKGLR